MKLWKRPKQMKSNKDFTTIRIERRKDSLVQVHLQYPFMGIFYYDIFVAGILQDASKEMDYYWQRRLEVFV